MPELADLLARAYRAQTPTGAARAYRQVFEQAPVGSPMRVQAGEGLGRALEKLELEQALKHYLKVLGDDRGGRHFYVYERLSILTYKIGDLALASRVIRLAVQRGAVTGVAFRRRAWRIADAAGTPRPFVPLRVHEWMVEARRDELFWYYGEMARDRRAWALAARRYDCIAPKSPRYAEGQTWRGHCLEQVLQVDEAIAAYERAAAVYEAAHRRDPDFATVIRRPFDRLIVLYEWRGDLERALDAVHRALETARKRPPASWWERAKRIAQQLGETLDREAWERASEPPARRTRDAFPVDQAALANGLREELRRLRQARREPGLEEKGAQQET